ARRGGRDGAELRHRRRAEHAGRVHRARTAARQGPGHTGAGIEDPLEARGTTMTDTLAGSQATRETDGEVLVVRGLRKTYEAEGAPVRALRGTDLTLERGEFAAIMGPSGCGKSTLLNLVAGLDRADEGEIVLAGEMITGRTED